MGKEKEKRIKEKKTDPPLLPGLFSDFLGVGVWDAGL